jgi:hypothetical protein
MESYIYTTNTKHGKDVYANSRKAAKSIAKLISNSRIKHAEIHRWIPNAKPHFHDSAHTIHVFFDWQ